MFESTIVLRDRSRARLASPFGDQARAPSLGLEAFGGGQPLAAAPELSIEVERVDRADRVDLLRDSEVVAAAPPMPLRLIAPVELRGAAGGSEAADAGDAWGIAAVGADRSQLDGSDVVVAVLDTGIDGTHPAFAGVTLVERDFSGDGDGDRNGHGTHCAGTIFGRDVAGRRIGVARGVTRALIGKVLLDDGGGDSDMIFHGLNWAVDQGADVISMSIGFDFPGMVDRLTRDNWPADLATSAALEAYRGNLRMFDAFMGLAQARQAFGAGPVVVAAAGNESRREVDPRYEIAASLPAAAEGVVSVGAVGQDGQRFQIAPFSNSFPQVAAPGVGVVSAKVGGGTTSLNGTSMACPHVAGVAALWWQAVREGTQPAVARTVVAKVLATARSDIFSAGVDEGDRGAGLVTAP